MLLGFSQAACTMDSLIAEVFGEQSKEALDKALRQDHDKLTYNRRAQTKTAVLSLLEIVIFRRREG